VRSFHKDSEKQGGAKYGRKTLMSGSTPVEKLDIAGQGDFEEWLGENKATTKGSISISIKSLREQELKALSQGKKSFRRIDFTEHNKVYILVEEREWIRVNESIDISHSP
jgi:hypothetical protein